MRKVVLLMHLTLDGVMQAPGRPDEDVRDGFTHGGWALPRGDAMGVVDVGLGSQGALLLGWRTYEDFYAFWPRQAENPFTTMQVSARLDEIVGLDPRTEAELYYIVVESLNNVLKHAAASEVTLLLAQVGHAVRVEVCDDGCGFDVAARKAGMGLRNIAERVAALNGRLELSSTPGGGTRLEVAIPITAGTEP